MKTFSNWKWIGFLWLTLVVPMATSAGEEPNRKELIRKMEQAMGPVPSEDRKVPLDLKVHWEEDLGTHLRKKVSYGVEENDRVPAWLLIPKDSAPDRTKKHPAMLCLHQTIKIGKDEPVGLGDQESKRQALHLVKRGYVCLAPDYPSFGEYEFDFGKAYREGKYQSGTMKAIWNNMRSVDLLQSLPEVDPHRIGAIGHSLGGHNSLYTAAFDERIQVAVTSCGFNSFHKYYGGNLKGWSSDRYMPRISEVYQNDPNKMPFDFDDVLLAIYPRAIFAMSPLHDANFEVSGVYDVLKKVAPIYEANGKREQLRAVHPDAAHEWPEAERLQAYEFIDRVLVNSPK